MINVVLVDIFSLNYHLFVFMVLIIPFFSMHHIFSVFFSPSGGYFGSFRLATVFQPRFSVFLWQLKPLERRELQK